MSQSQEAVAVHCKFSMWNPKETENLAGTYENDGQTHRQTNKSHHSAKHT